MLFTARHKAGKSIAEMSWTSGLSGPYLVHIERGIRSPVPNKVPAIATAYGVDPSEACWSWVTSFAPQMVRHLVTYGTLEDTPFLQRHYRQQYVEQVAKKEAEQVAEKTERAAVAARRRQRFAAATQDPGTIAPALLRVDLPQAILDLLVPTTGPSERPVGDCLTVEQVEERLGLGPSGIMSDEATQSTQNKVVR